MTEPRQYDGGAGTAQNAPKPHYGQSSNPSAASSASSAHTGSEAVAGPFTLRETVIGVSVLVMFIGTILPFVEGVNLWMTFSLFFLGIGILLPIAALGLLVGRRMGSKNLRVGSLSVDQFASVAAAFASAFFFLQTVTTFGIGQFIALLGSVAFLLATVGGPHLGIFKTDFTGRPSSSAHLIAREALPVRPRAPKPVPAEQVGQWQGPSTGSAGVPTPGAGASGGPSSAGYSAGYAVAGYAAGQHQNGPQPAPGAQQQQNPQQPAFGEPAEAAQSGPASSVSAAESRPVEAGPDQQPAPDSIPERQDETAAPSEVSSSDDGSSDRSEQEPNASEEGPASPPGEPAAPAPTMAHPKIESAHTTSGATQQGSGQGNGPADSQSHPRTESISATREADDDEPMVEAFWFAVGTPRSVVDEQSGAQLFVLQPGDWEVGIEDRGHEFLVQDKRTGRIGVMRDLRNIERAPREA
ncbi:hypothetical protein BJ994_002503 [Arthrobacter pigmenti]|uniref:Uncharacterized protein n=1 Tax=Arthrobacter pigmenti TaxID=271432 RepID=A0A846RTC5_9MICC|nr:hypothetical protein [Arthrobacter pigmenti]NJC23427.1 hypothetical protein [Arthrobacter pigmenti]